MSDELPEGWARVRLGNLLSEPMANGRSVADGSGFPVLRLTALRAGRVDLRERKLGAWRAQEASPFRVRRGDFLIARGNGSLALVGRGGLVEDEPDPVAYPDTAIRVRPDKTILLPEYLRAVWDSADIRQQIEATAHTTAGIHKVRQSDLAAVEVPVAPLAEQHRIVSKIEALLAEVSASREYLAKARAILKRFRQSVLAAACSGRLTEEWRKTVETETNRISNDGKSSNDEENLATLPSGWRWSKLDAFLEDIEAGRSFSCVERPPGPDEVGVVKVSAVTWGTYLEEESKTCMDPSKVESALFVRQGDFLFSRANTIDLVGACVLVERTSRRVMLSDKILRFKLVGISPRWLLLALRSRHGRTEIERLATGNQQSMRNIGQGRIREIRIPLPPPDEMEEAVRQAETLLRYANTIEKQVAAASARVDRLTPSILAKAFRGELVPTEAELANQEDRKYEPASVPLERIRSFREDAKAGPRHGGPRKRAPGPVDLDRDTEGRPRAGLGSRHLRRRSV
jgi:type I restriction enzyme S subunit